MVCGYVKGTVSGSVQGAVITTSSTVFVAALPTPYSLFSRMAAGYIGGMAAYPLAEEISKPFEEFADKACRSALEVLGIDNPKPLKHPTDSVKISANTNSFFTSTKTNKEHERLSLGIQTGQRI